MDPNSQLTMRDIAAMLGVSVATVSRALKDSPNISKQRREQIQKFARDHHYYPNLVAEQLRHSRQSPVKVIGVIVPEFIHYYFASILTGIERAAAARGYRIIVAGSYESHDLEVAVCKSFVQNRVCGIIVSQAKDTVDYSHFISLSEQKMPLVFYDRICPALNASRVVVDDYMGTLKAVSYLIERGCRRIAYYGTSPNMEIGKNRYNGYKDALYRNGLTLDESIVTECDTREQALTVTPELLRRADRPDAVFAVNDDTAVGVLTAAKEVGLRVPDDLMICGFSNSAQAVSCDPQLTTVEQSGVRVGEEAAEILIGHVEGLYDLSHAQKRVIKTSLIVRGTTR